MGEGFSIFNLSKTIHYFFNLSLVGILAGSVVSYADEFDDFSKTKIKTQNELRTKSRVKKKESKLFKKFNLSTDFNMRGASFAEGQEESQVVQLQVTPKAFVRFHDYFSAKLKGTLSLNSSRVQTRFQDPNSEVFHLDELIATVSPGNYFDFSAGAIDQSHFDNEFLVSPRAFPGLMLSSNFKMDKRFSAKTKLQYSVPTSTSLEADRREAEELPTFKTAGVKLKWKPLNWLKTTANINYFTYSDLPSVVAHESQRLGNEVSGSEPTESFFRYGFYGLSHSYALSLKYTRRISNFFKIKIVENNAAPKDSNRAQYISTGFHLKFKNLSVTPSVAVFYSEANSSPALYNAVEFGHNNREGIKYGLNLDFPRLGFNLKTNYIQADLLRAQASQRDLKYIEVLLGVANVRF